MTFKFKIVKKYSQLINLNYIDQKANYSLNNNCLQYRNYQILIEIVSIHLITFNKI